jgi:hypothetical protein
VRFTLSTAWAANTKGGPKTLSDPNAASGALLQVGDRFRFLDLGFRS